MYLLVKFLSIFILLFGMFACKTSNNNIVQNYPEDPFLKRKQFAGNLFGNKDGIEIFKEKIEEEGDFSNKSADFDKILELSMNAVSETETEIKKDDRFLKILNVKNVSSKLEYLIVTAYYLSEFEKLDKFTLKLINAKLMQNIKEAVDHNVLQEAIDNGLVEVLPSLPNIANSVEYRLTNAGEEAFLNGTKL